MADDFQQKSDAFLNWFKGLPGSTFHDSLELADLRARGAGRGVVATADIGPGTVLFTVPRAGILTARYASTAEKLEPFWRAWGEDSDEVDPEEHEAKTWLRLVVILIHEYLHGDISDWKPYLDVFPRSFDTPMFWNQQELAEMQGSAITEKIGREEADLLFKRMVTTMREQKDLFYPEGEQQHSDDEMLQLAHLMGSTVMAYAFDMYEKDSDDEEEPDEDGWVVDKGASTELGMVPMADMLNADAEFNAHLQHGADALTMTSLRAIKAGEEVLNYYGAIPSGDLLRRYGYTSPKHSRYDVVEIPWKLVLRAVAEQLGKTEQEVIQAVAETGMEPYELEDSFVLDRDSEPGPSDEGLLSSEITAVTIPVELQQVLKEVVPSFVHGPTAKAEYCKVLSKVFDLRLAQYATTIEDDEALLTSTSLPHRQRLAIDLRLGEKKILHEARGIVIARLERVTADEPPTKKQKR